MARREFLQATRRTLMVASLGFLALFWASPTDSLGNTPKPRASAVHLIVDYGDGIQKRFTISLKRDMTVFDAMKVAQASPHGLKFQYESKNGAPQTFFLTQIDDVGNEGPGAGRKNWLYWANGRLACEGFGVHKLKAGDTVLWKLSAFHGYKSDGSRPRRVVS